MVVAMEWRTRFFFCSLLFYLGIEFNQNDKEYLLENFKKFFNNHKKKKNQLAICCWFFFFAAADYNDNGIKVGKVKYSVVTQ